MIPIKALFSAYIMTEHNILPSWLSANEGFKLLAFKWAEIDIL